METNFLNMGNAPKVSVIALPEKAGGRELSERIITAIAAANESLQQTTARLIRLAELAYDARHFDELQAISAALLSVPFAAARRAGSYYQAVLVMRAGQFERAAGQLATINAPRALLTLGAIETARGNWTEAARYHVETMRAARGVDLLSFACAAAQLATIHAAEGDHAASLRAFFNLAPLVRTVSKAHPYVWASWHNSLAVELAALGRADEGRAAVAVALASPVAERYPEFEATAAELAEVEHARVEVAGVVAEPKREARRRQSLFIVPLVTHHLSLVTCQSSVVSGQYPVGSNAFIRTRAAPRAAPRAPPFVSIR
jgi:hypothetical protein